MPCGERVSQVMPPKIRNLSPLQRVPPCLGVDLDDWIALVSENMAWMSAFDKAQKLNGTHIVWEPQQQGYGSSQVTGKVYSCKQ